MNSAPSEPKAVAGPIADQPRWLQATERGSVLGIRLLVWLATFAGRRPTSLLLGPIALYYALTNREARRASSDFLQRVHGRPTRFSAVVAHLRTFGQVTLDRLFMLRGQHECFTVQRTGGEILQRVLDDGRGAVILSAHLGSMAASKIGDARRRERIYIAGFFRNAAMINAALGQFDAGSGARVVHIDPGSPRTVLAVRDLVEAGNLVAIAADRAGLNDRVVQVPFLGQSATFPLGPFILAAILRKPVVLAFALFESPNRYHFHCELFSDGIVAPRKGRDAALRAEIVRYAQRLEHYARLAPMNWFNFYDFWAIPPDSASATQTATAGKPDAEG